MDGMKARGIGGKKHGDLVGRGLGLCARGVYLIRRRGGSGKGCY